MEYHHDDSDTISLSVNAASDGFLRVRESWDPGWRATVGGVPITPVLADVVFLTVPVRSGPHRVVFEYSTPGAAAGLAVSAASFLGLLLLTFSARRRKGVPSIQQSRSVPGND